MLTLWDWCKDGLMKFKHQTICPLYTKWRQQRIKSKITYRSKNLKISQNYLVILQQIHRVRNWKYACKSWCKRIPQYQSSVSYCWIVTDITYTGTWQVCKIKWVKWKWKYCKTLIIRVTLFSRGHQPRYIHETLFSRFVRSSSIFLIIEIICEDFIFASLSSREFTLK